MKLGGQQAPQHFQNTTTNLMFQSSSKSHLGNSKIVERLKHDKPSGQ